MNNDDAQAILAIIVLIAVLAIVFIPFVLFLAYVFFQKGKRSRTREKLLREQEQLVGNRQWFPVRYASEPRFKALFKIFPWECAGILVMASGSSLFLGETVSGSPVTLQFAPAASTLTWLGKAPWPNGAVSWFYFATPTEKHYSVPKRGLLYSVHMHQPRRFTTKLAKALWHSPHPKIETGRISDRP